MFRNFILQQFLNFRDRGRPVQAPATNFSRPAPPRCVCGIVEAGHQESTLQLNRVFCLSPAAIQQNVFDGSDTQNLFVAHGNGRGPRLFWIIGVDATVQVKRGLVQR